MGKALKLVNKLNRRRKLLKTRGAGFDRKDKIDESEEKMARSHKAYTAALRPQRRLDRNLGKDMIAMEPKISKKVKTTTVERYDTGGSVYAIKVTLPAAVLADLHVIPGDILRFLNGKLKGRYLKVVSILSSTQLRLEDATAMAFAGAKQVDTVQTVADVAGSLNGKYFDLPHTPNLIAFKSYVWIDIDGANNDPALSNIAYADGGIRVTVASNASAATIASAIAAAVSAAQGGAVWTATAVGNLVTITAVSVGESYDATDSGATGFTIATPVQGADPNPTPSESNTIVRVQLSDVKASWT